MLSKFDFELPVNLVPLVEEIEEKYKSRILLIRDPNLRAHAACRISDNGVPELHVKRGTTYDIAHELAHLRCRARGYPSTRTLIEAINPMTSTACTEIQSVVEHQIIYPELIELGFDPHEDVCNSVLAVGMTTLAPLPNIGHVDLATSYLRVEMETNSPEIISALDRRYKKYGPAFRSTARKMKFQIVNNGVASVESYVAGLVGALSVLNVEEHRDYKLDWG